MGKRDESLKAKTIKGSFWSFADNILNTGISFLVGLVLARLLTPHEYGLIGIVLIFVAIFNTIVDSGFSNALIRKKDINEKDYNTVFYTNLVISIILFLIMLFIAPYIANFFEQPLLAPLTRAMSLIILINAFAIIQRTVLVKKIDFKTQTKVSFIASITSGVVGISMAFLNFGVWALVGQQITRQFLNTLFLWIYAQWFPRLQFSLASFKELFGFSWKLLTSSLIDIIWQNIYQLVIGKCYSAETLGYFSRSQQFSSLPSSNLTLVIRRVTYPVLSSIQDDVVRLREAYRKVIKVTMFLAFTMMFGLASIAKPLVIVLIGEKWLMCVGFLQILCLSDVWYPLHALNLNMLQIQGRSDLFLRLEIIKKIIAIGPILLGIFINIYWMLFGSVISGLFALYLNSYYSGPYLNYSITQQLKDILPSFLISIFMAVIVYSLSFISLSQYLLLPIQIITGVIIVISLSHFFKLEEYIELKNILFSYIKRSK